MAGVPAGATRPKAAANVVQWVPEAWKSNDAAGAMHRPEIRIVELRMESGMGYNPTIALREAIEIARKHGMKDEARNLGNRLGGLILGYKRRGEEEPRRKTLTMRTEDWFRIVAERHRLVDLQRAEEGARERREEVAEVDRVVGEAFG
jgi:hypothetical protein